MLKMIYFDVGGTLIYTANSHELIFKESLDRFNIKIELDEIKSAVESVLKVHPSKELSFTDLVKNKKWWITFYSMVLETLNINNSKDEVINTLWDKHRKGVNLSIFSDAVEVLNNLFNKGFKLGIISNWDDTLYYMLEKFYIKDFFENVVVSSEIGYEKPDLRIFRYAIDKSALNPENICYVGDDYDKDFLPSNKLGMHSIYLCHKEVYPFAACDSKHPRNLKDVEKIIQLNG